MKTEQQNLNVSCDTTEHCISEQIKSGGGGGGGTLYLKLQVFCLLLAQFYHSTNQTTAGWAKYT